MPRTTFSNFALLATLALPLTPATTHAQTATEAAQRVVGQLDIAPTLIPDDAAWSLVLDIAKLKQSNLVQGFYSRLDATQQDKLNDLIDGLSNTAGINLAEELGTVVAFGNTFNPDDAGLAFEIADAQTNLEGLLLTTEGYESREHGNHIVHSFLAAPGHPDGPPPHHDGKEARGQRPRDHHQPPQRRMFASIVPQAQTGKAIVVVSTGEGLAEQLIDDIDTGKALAKPDALAGDEFLRLSVSRLPDEAFAHNPRQSNIARMIESMQLVGSTGPQRTALALTLDMPSEARANQIFQLASAGKALIEMAAGNDADASKLNDLLSYVAVDRPADNTQVRITAACDTADIEGLMDMLEQSGALRDLKLD